MPVNHSLQLAVSLGLASAGFWGVSDLFARYSSRAMGPFRTLLFSQVVGLVLLTGYLTATHGFASALRAPLQAWVWAAIAGMLFNAATLVLYRAFETGVLAIVSPISAGYAVVTAAMSLLSGERFTAAMAAGMALVLCGVPLAASPHEADAPGLSVDDKMPRSPKSSGVGLAMLSAVGYGVCFWIYGYKATPELGGVAPVWVNYALASAVLPLGLLNRSLRGIPSLKNFALSSAVGTLAVIGTTCDLTGLATGHVAVVTALSSLYSTVTVVLAWLLLREEPLARRQWLGVALILAGVAVVRS